MKLIKHLWLLTKHKYLVFIYCFRCRLFVAAFVHDLSKYSFEELTLARYYNGTRSPIPLERQARGYSLGGLHHKGRNKHHFEYWTDLTSAGIQKHRIPYRYLAEMVCDMVAAGKIYRGKKWTKEQPREYWLGRSGRNYFHSASRTFLDMIYDYLAEHGLKKTLKKKVLRNFYLLTNKDASNSELLPITDFHLD